MNIRMCDNETEDVMDEVQNSTGKFFPNLTVKEVSNKKLIKNVSKHKINHERSSEDDKSNILSGKDATNNTNRNALNKLKANLKKTKDVKLKMQILKENIEPTEEYFKIEADTRFYANKGEDRALILSETNGHFIEKVTYYDTWHVIRPHFGPTQSRQQLHCVELPLVELANAANQMKLPSDKWCHKITLFKIRPRALQTQSFTIYTGDLKIHKIPEIDRYKYQPSSVIFRRVSAVPGSALGQLGNFHERYDRVIIFKHKFYTINFDGKHIHLNGAPEAVTSLQDIQKLLDIIDSITLSNSMIEIVPPQ